jgi:hypothetical protein
LGCNLAGVAGGCSVVGAGGGGICFNFGNCC